MARRRRSSGSPPRSSWTPWRRRMCFPATPPRPSVRSRPAAGRLFRGAQNFLTDVATNKGMPRQVIPRRSRSAADLAATPGKVVLQRADRALQYALQNRDPNHEVPLLCSPPWINKYYVMDLAPKRSFIEWAGSTGTLCRDQRRNADMSMRDVTLDDSPSSTGRWPRSGRSRGSPVPVRSTSSALPRRHAHGDAKGAPREDGGASRSFRKRY